MALPDLVVETWKKPEAFWAAASSVVTLIAVVVALLSPRAQARRLREQEHQKAKAILPSLFDELNEASERAEKAVQLIRSEMAGVLRPPITVASGMVWERVISPQSKKRLIDLALVEFPAYEAFGGQIKDLPFDQSEFLVQAYGQLLRARLRIRKLIEGWDTASGVDPELMRAYSSEADTLLAASSRCVYYLSWLTDREIPERLLPRAVAEERRQLAATRLGRLRLWWRARHGDL